jgi:hypothetical protein
VAQRKVVCAVAIDTLQPRRHDGRSVRILNLIDEYTRECLMIRAERRWSSAKLIGALADVRVIKGYGRTTARSSSRRTCASGS